MRRLATQDRGERYGSSRDYQDVSQEDSVRIVGRLRINFNLNRGDTTYVGLGGYFRGTKEGDITITMVMGETNIHRSVSLDENWARFGQIFSEPTANALTVEIRVPDDLQIDCWGLVAEKLNSEQLPSIEIEELNKAHLIPETLYLSHRRWNDWNNLVQDRVNGERIRVKKCSICQRYLPVNQTVRRSSFHRHASKISGFQNECRSCKKWRINDTFNPLRTPDQLHESSVITRERKRLLREPEILQEVKDRTGSGLRSQVWERFNRRCFKCDTNVGLRDFQLDHTMPLAYLWPIDEFATCLCADCNNSKHDQFPVDFYTNEELERLVQITGIDNRILRLKDVNEDQLNRVIQNIVTFSRELEARTFQSIRRCVLECRPTTDLFEILRTSSEEEFRSLQARLAERPESVGI
jgi:hypothetical protein